MEFIIIFLAVIAFISELYSIEKVKRIIMRYEEERDPLIYEKKVAYVCDRKQCKNCSYPECKHTTNIKHANNFVKQCNVYMEIKEDEK